MLLEIRDIKVHYDKFEAIKGLSLQVGKGDIVIFLGANGAGKSTVLKTISGLKHPPSGEIWFFDQKIDRSQLSSINLIIH